MTEVTLKHDVRSTLCVLGVSAGTQGAFAATGVAWILLWGCGNGKCQHGRVLSSAVTGSSSGSKASPTCALPWAPSD